MTTQPTATPRTDASKCRMNISMTSVELDAVPALFACALETEVAAEREKVRVLREALESLAYWSRNNTETRQTLRDHIAAALAATKEGA